ncbi:MAG: hypothetical protein GQ540_03215 [Lutibacter sp.]|uniref:hypothetical protein n=1 Tax=Lutibacter sp. TaxID=1925666 RepID=UPI001A0BED4F|nr:hypothetical protein [Lutibacter sp.]NOR27521.1 hypothetical protein [Lutibacter sp.]
MGDYWKDNNIEKPQQVVVCAACRSGEVIFSGARHFDKVMNSQIRAVKEYRNLHGFTEGFIDQFGDFLTRKEAMKIAIAAGQKVDIECGCGGHKDILFSEGLY